MKLTPVEYSEEESNARPQRTVVTASIPQMEKRLMDLDHHQDTKSLDQCRDFNVIFSAFPLTKGRQARWSSDKCQA
ncbi:hypothetical protein NPIL_361111 [Nephila pilipes]|uniref:Uncharacterized protein n=1 Tax=Nephila pilipes TaxID=299642 RepID=A0A8X6NS11_NEPPI|nr:hypothetical protein NPIL_361111 [Nephila pilipes]